MHKANEENEVNKDWNVLVSALWNVHTQLWHVMWFYYFFIYLFLSFDVLDTLFFLSFGCNGAHINIY